MDCSFFFKLGIFQLNVSKINPASVEMTLDIWKQVTFSGTPGNMCQLFFQADRQMDRQAEKWMDGQTEMEL